MNMPNIELKNKKKRRNNVFFFSPTRNSVSEKKHVYWNKERKSNKHRLFQISCTNKISKDIKHN